MATPRIPQPPDVVTLSVVRNPLTGRRIINGSSVIGSAAPCAALIAPGSRLAPAVRCLVRSGFRLIARTQGIWVFRRIR
ncbi:hypothetical protein J2T17_002991 [Paenibacillus mucilaginosus]|uniref:hypothetical protein n=1 Tax=Paenibacillus mucilaginosus TaxID=61624 RepID=UPI003D1A07B2